MIKLVRIFLIIFTTGTCMAQQDSHSLTIRFAKNKFELSSEARTQVTLLAESLRLRNGYLIYINGHADSDAAHTFNHVLSLKRSLSVREVLMERGIDSASIITQAMGEEQPLVANTTAVSKAQNRRVELLVLFEREAAEQTAASQIIKSDIIACDDADTTVIINDNYKITLSKCDWQKNKECLRVEKSLRYNFKVKENWLKKHIGFKNYKKYIACEPHYQFIVRSCLDSCFVKAIKLYIPQYQAKGLDITKPLSQKKDNKGRSARLVIKKNKGVDSAYYTTYIHCPGILNCGFDNRCGHDVKLKARGGLRIIDYSYSKKNRRFTADTLITTRPADPNELVDNYQHTFFITLRLTNAGDTTTLRSVPIDVFPHGLNKIKRRGGDLDKKYILFIPFNKFYKCGHYKKYKVRPRHLESLRNFDLRELMIPI